MNTLAFALAGQHKTDEADHIYRQALHIFREHYEDYHYPVVLVSNNLLPLARAKGDQATIDELRSLAEKVLSRPDASSDSLHEAAGICLGLAEWAQAEQCIARLLDHGPVNAEFLNCRPLLQLVQRDFDGYRETCQAVAAIAERQADSRALLLAAATCLLGPDSGVDSERVRKLADRALIAAPSDPRHRQVAAVAHYRAGSFEEAHRRLRASIEADSKNDSDPLHAAYCRLFLAMTEQRLNRRNDAQTSLRLAMDGVEAMLENPRIRWDHRLTLRLWREEAEQVVESGELH